MISIYGIKQCDTVKKALRQLDTQGTQYQFVDLKTTTLSEALLADWLKQCPDTLVNKRSTTYRKIKLDWLAAEDLSTQIALIQAHQTVLKRPILQYGSGDIVVGFDAAIYQNL